MSFNGALFSTSIATRQYGVQLAQDAFPAYVPRGNGGAGAIELAARFGASKIIMLGYDCAPYRGKVHHHGDHPPHLGNAGSMAEWPAIFEKLAADHKGIVNASRRTALRCFQRMTLSDALHED